MANTAYEGNLAADLLLIQQGRVCTQRLVVVVRQQVERASG
jgi:hypothetical protein